MLETAIFSGMRLTVNEYKIDKPVIRNEICNMSLLTSNCLIKI